MDDSWIPVYSTNQLYRAEIVKELLFDNQIMAFVLNQQDSTYLFGEVEVCVKQGDIIRAKHIINKFEF